MSLGNSLLIIDEDPIKKEFESYFAQFNIGVIQQKSLYPINTDLGMPLALLIHWRILQNNPQSLVQIYKTYPIPIIVFNDTLNDGACILALESGADDFLCQPLSARDIHARITAISRRIKHIEDINNPEKDALQFANWRMHLSSRQIFDQHNNELVLSAGEFDLLYLFIQQPQRVLDRELLLQLTKQSEHSPLDRRIDVQISRLRQKIELDAKKPTLIKTIRNGGYMFTAAVKKLEEEVSSV